MPERTGPLALQLAHLRQLMEEARERADARRAGPAGGPQPAAAADPAEPAAGSDAVPLEALIPGEVVGGGGAGCFVRRQTLSLEHRHGRYPLHTAMEVDGPGLAWLAQPSTIASGALADAAFIDVETTGLAGGTGTLAFLVGMAWFEGGRLHLGQWFMRAPHEEPALLEQVASVAQGRGLVVGFNSRAFDLPLLETRFVLGRRRFPFPSDHVDLLHPSRQVWRLRLASCRLANLEERVLGVVRQDDVPGWMVPQLYLQYLRTGDARPLGPVFTHNLLDLLSLVTLAGRLGQLHRNPRAALADDAADLVALGRCFERRPHSTGGPDLSRHCYEEALSHGVTGAGAELARLSLARGHRRQGQWEGAREQWLEVAAHGSPAARRTALVELAKWAEHRARDPAQALAWARQALDQEPGPAPATATPFERDLRHRISRLEHKLR